MRRTVPTPDGVANIQYSYLDEAGAERTGTWTGDPTEALAAAAEFLGATELSGGDFEYSEHPGAGIVRAPRESLVRLGAAVLSGHGAAAFVLWRSAEPLRELYEDGAVVSDLIAEIEAREDAAREEARLAAVKASADLMPWAEIHELCEARGVSPREFWVEAAGGDRVDLPRDVVERILAELEG